MIILDPDPWKTFRIRPGPDPGPDPQPWLTHFYQNLFLFTFYTPFRLFFNHHSLTPFPVLQIIVYMRYVTPKTTHIQAALIGGLLVFV